MPPDSEPITMFRMAIVPDQRHFPRLSTPNHRISTGGFRLNSLQNVGAPDGWECTRRANAGPVVLVPHPVDAANCNSPDGAPTDRGAGTVLQCPLGSGCVGGFPPETGLATWRSEWPRLGGGRLSRRPDGRRDGGVHPLGSHRAFSRRHRGACRGCLGGSGPPAGTAPGRRRPWWPCPI